MRYLSATATREVPENTEAGVTIGDPVTATDPDTGNTLTYTLEGTDLDSFDIDSASGQIQTKPGVTYDHETKSSYSVTVKADEKNGGIATIDVTITITVTDVDEPLTVNGETSVGYPENSDGQVATYSATDPDNGQITWSLSGDDAGGFSISNTGELTFQTAPEHEAPADDNTDNRYELTVEASDESVKGALDVTVTVTDVNEPPAFSVETASRTIAENTTTGVAIGDPVTATDPDTGDTPAYTLGGTDANFFDIDASSGQLGTKAGLDYEVKNTYQISVSVRDGKNAEGNPDAADDATITVTVTVTNVEEPGKVTLNLLQPQVGTGLTTIVTDPDGGVRGMTWEWESSSDNKDTWTPISGAVSGTFFPVDADVGNYLRVTVSYTDQRAQTKARRQCRTCRYSQRRSTTNRRLSPKSRRTDPARISRRRVRGWRRPGPRRSPGRPRRPSLFGSVSSCPYLSYRSDGGLPPGPPARADRTGAGGWLRKKHKGSRTGQLIREKTRMLHGSTRWHAEVQEGGNTLEVYQWLPTRQELDRQRYRRKGKAGFPHPYLFSHATAARDYPQGETGPDESIYTAIVGVSRGHRGEPLDFAEHKLRAKVRDGMECQQCGTRTDLHVHHTRGMKSHALHTLVTLCRTCHEAVHRTSQLQTV